MLNEGKMISGRYEIISRVGSGGMADVYRAKDHRLNRFVAIKVLKQEYAGDRNFVQKFRAEAQSVAGLSHPNIVNVYDVGEEDGLYYIVMELVEGITLKRFIERKGKLDVREAIGISIQIAQGMEAAHQKHIVHRDIKPQNIIISKEGKVKVTDFGIAKAATSTTITSGQPVGSVHYISPEQARGGYSDEKSDIYSLGVTMYEMLSGRMPFAADNTVSVALLHIQEEATPLRELDPDIPVSVEKIVQKCMQKKPERRYLTATALIRDLKQSIVDPDGDFVELTGGGATDSPTINISSKELADIKKKRFATGVSSAAVSKGAEETRTTQKTTSSTTTRHEEVLDPEDDDDGMNPILERLMLVGGILAILALAGVIIWLVVRGFNLIGSMDPLGGNSQVTSTMTPGSEENGSGAGQTSTSGETTSAASQSAASQTGNQDSQSGETAAPSDEGDETTPVEETLKVPEVTGTKVNDAIAELKAQGISYRFEYESSETVEEDYIISVEPKDGTEIEKADIVILTISSGQAPVQVQDVSNQSAEAARAALEGQGFEVDENEDYSDSVAKGNVISTSPDAGATLKKGDRVTMTISLGPEKKAVPNLKGMTQDAAISALTAESLRYTVSEENSTDVEKGRVISQSIAAGSAVDPLTTVAFVVSLGEPEPEYIYVTSLTIPAADCPFSEEDEGANVVIDMDQDGAETKELFRGTLSYSDFPLTLNNIEGANMNRGVVYMYVDGELYTEATWRVDFEQVEK